MKKRVGVTNFYYIVDNNIKAISETSRSRWPLAQINIGKVAFSRPQPR